MDTQSSYFQLFIHSLSLIFLAFIISACSSTGSDTGPEKLFDSGNIAPGASYSYTFQDEGTVDYYCEIHAPNMQGVVNVTESAEISGQDTVDMVNSQFNPSQITVAPGTEIVWTNSDSESHTVVSGNPGTGGNGGY